MKKISAEMGKLYLVGTPLGNLDDMGFRAIETLKKADEIYCEDTRRTSILLRHFKIEGKNLQSFHDHSPRSVLVRIKKRLIDGSQIAYVTDGGMPSISDPGFVLVRMCRENGIPVTAIPGPSASSMLFSVSGLPSPKFLFHGFFPRTKGEVEKVCELIKEMGVVHIFYEAPSRILSTMEIFSRNCPDANVFLGRELTKVHEEFLFGTAKDLHEDLKNHGDKVRGEFSIAICMAGVNKKNFYSKEKNAGSEVENSVSDDPSQLEQNFLSAEQQAEIASLIKSGMTSKDASKLLSKKFGLPRKIIYDFIIRHLT